MSAICGRTRRDFGAILLTCTVLIMLLGLSVSVIGLVAILNGSLYVVGEELFALIATFNLAYVAICIALERRNFVVGLPARDSVRSDA
jgi:type IV secretory pathway VirB3-like protein